MMLELLVVDEVPQIGPYSHAARVGPWVYTAGMGGVDPGTGEVVSDDVVEQAAQAIRNTAEILRAASCTLSDVVKVTLYLTDPADYDRVNRVYAEWFGEHRPVRTCIVAANLPARERVKLESIAYRDVQS
jgi:2-iminobutanoate/2-iminopropanoate deaminase